MSRNHQLASFPNLADSEFEEACNALLRRFELHAHRQSDWTEVQNITQNGATFLRITVPLVLDPDVADGSDDNEEVEMHEEEEDDEVALPAPSNRAAIHYDITLSPSYRVPVLYFAITDPLHRYPPTMSTLYTHIIPPLFRSQAEHVGVIGGITVADHPATNKPVFFIHPCRTAEVMEASVGGRYISAFDYLMVWTGALGKCVGLDVPMSLVEPTSLE